MKVKNIGKIKDFECDKCNKFNENLNRIEFEELLSSYETNIFIDLCDECLQELNRKIVDYLADNNI